jgi:uncharacterized cupredoxin-like copper-binding protein
MPNPIPLLLVAGAVAFLSSSTIRDARPPAKVAVVTVHARDFAYALPARIAAGQTTFRLVNDGKEIHQLSIVKLAPGKSMADFREAMKTPGPEATWMTDVGGPNAAVPGGAVEATISLDAGNYVVVCSIPSPGEPMPHMAKGMIAPLTVVPARGPGPASGTVTAAPVPDVHLVLKDYGFAFSTPLTAGRHVIHVMNEGPQTHEAVFIKLAPGKHVADFAAWAGPGGMQGPPPAMPVDGMAGLGKGRTAIFPANLTPGTYALICFVPDAKDMKPHAEHGMTLEFEVQ